MVSAPSNISRLTMETICEADNDGYVIDEMDRLIPAGVSGRIIKTQIDHCTAFIVNKLNNYRDGS